MFQFGRKQPKVEVEKTLEEKVQEQQLIIEQQKSDIELLKSTLDDVILNGGAL